MPRDPQARLHFPWNPQGKPKGSSPTKEGSLPLGVGGKYSLSVPLKGNSIYWDRISLIYMQKLRIKSTESNKSRLWKIQREWKLLFKLFNFDNIYCRSQKSRQQTKYFFLPENLNSHSSPKWIENKNNFCILFLAHFIVKHISAILQKATWADYESAIF